MKVKVPTSVASTFVQQETPTIEPKLPDEIFEPCVVNSIHPIDALDIESLNSVKHYSLFRPPILNYGLINFNLNTLDAKYT